MEDGGNLIGGGGGGSGGDGAELGEGGGRYLFFRLRLSSFNLMREVGVGKNLCGVSRWAGIFALTT